MNTDPWEGLPVAPDANAVDHSQCNFGWKQVRCDRCGAEYQCTPSSDHYCTPEGDHCCETCLLRGAGVPVLTVVVVPRRCECRYAEGRTESCGRTADLTEVVHPFGELPLAVECRNRVNR